MNSSISAKDLALSTYRELLAKVDRKVAAITTAHPHSLQCRLGCHSCCKPGLTVSALEAENLQLYFAAHPEVSVQLPTLASQNPHGGTRCELLDEQGACTIYPVRPLVCRSHGVPLKIHEAGKVRLDVCPLNFQGEGLAVLPAADAIDLETLNTLLSLLNRQFSGDSDRPRLPLTAKGLTQSIDSPA